MQEWTVVGDGTRDEHLHATGYFFCSLVTLREAASTGPTLQQTTANLGNTGDRVRVTRTVGT